MSMAAISTRGLTKKYGNLTAVHALDLEVEQGEIFGFLGLNGAGKTTTIRMLLDLLRPDAGSATILGYDCRREGLRVRAEIGYLPGEVGLYGDLTGAQLLDLLSGLQNRPADPERRAELLERLEFPARDLRRRLREYSTGMKRKLCLIQALQGNPALLILDEPTEGLDPLIQESFYTLLFELKRQGRTIFMSSHVLSEVERVCERIALIRRGKLALQASVAELHKMAQRTVRITFSADVTSPVGRLPYDFEIVDSQPRFWVIRARGALRAVMEVVSGLPVSDIDIVEARLEEVLLRYYREEGA